MSLRPTGAPGLSHQEQQPMLRSDHQPRWRQDLQGKRRLSNLEHEGPKFIVAASGAEVEAGPREEQVQREPSHQKSASPRPGSGLR
jgi:hypothetical protein